MSRNRVSRVLFLSFALMLILSLLVACGGGDDDDSGSSGSSSGFPTPSGAEKIGEEDTSAEDIDAGDINMSNATALAYKVSGKDFDDVADFYENGVVDEGWTVEEHVSLGEIMLAVIHKDDRLAITTAMTASAMREQGGTADLGDLSIDVDDLDDADIIIVSAVFTCEEDSIDTCIAAMDLGL